MTSGLVLFFHACEETTDVDFSPTCRIESVDHIEVHLDSLTSIDATSIVPGYINDILYLFIGNELNNSIDVYNATSGAMVKRLTFEREGPNSIPQLRTCVFVNEDSIYVFGSFHILRTKLIDWNGKIIDTQPVSYNAIKDYTFVNHIGKIHFFDKSLFMCIGPLFDFYSGKNVNTTNSFVYEFDLVDQKLIEHPIYPPESYKNKPQSSHTIVPNMDLGPSGTLLISWPTDKYMEVRSISDPKHVRQVNAHVPGFNPLLARVRSGRDQKKSLAEALDHVLYTSVLYDRFRNMYYRIASLPSGKYVEEDLTHWTAFGRNKVGIIAMDSNFDIVAWRILPEEKYNCFRTFVTKEGLAVSLANPYWKDFDENKLVYEIFSCVDISYDLGTE